MSAAPPLRVLHVLPAVAARYGGTTTAVLPLVARLAARPGLRVELAATDADGPGRRLTAADLPAGGAYHLFPRVGTDRWKYSPALRRWLRAEAGRYDLLHLHSIWSHATATAAAAARRAGVPYILSPHGMLSPYTFSRRWWLKAAYWRLIERRTVFGAAVLQATSEQEADELRAVRPGADVVVVDNGVEDRAWTEAADPDALRRRCGPAAGDRPIVLFLSRLHPKKGLVDLLLPAAARLRTPAYLAIGGGADDSAPGYPEEVRRTVDRLGLGDRVGLLGPVAAADRWRLFDGAAVFVLPSHQENFGIVVAEAMARGRPVVVTDQVQAGPHVTAAGAGRVVPRDPAALAAALDALLADPAEGAAVGRRAAAYAGVQFRWDRIADAVSAMYVDCLSARRPPA